MLVRPDRNGYIYVLDRTTGEVLSAEPFGRDQLDQGRRPQDRAADREPGEGDRHRQGRARHLPDCVRAKDWQPSAFSPRTGLLYIPHNNLCMDEEGVEVNYIAGTPYVGMNVRMIAGPRRQSRRVHGLGRCRGRSLSGSSKENFPSGAAPW